MNPKPLMQVLDEINLLDETPTTIYSAIGANQMIKIKSRNVYRDEELIGKVVGDRFGESYRRSMNVSCDFAYIPIKDGVPDYENRLDLSMFGYFKDACDWLKINLA